MSAFKSLNYTVVTFPNGTFSFSHAFNSSGVWAVEAAFPGDSADFPCYANQIVLSVQEQPFYVKDGVFIGGGGFFGVVGLCLFYYVRKRRQ